MESAVKILYSPEEQARQEIRSFVNEGLKDVGENAIYDFDEAFDALESRYKVERVWCCFDQKGEKWYYRYWWLYSVYITGARNSISFCDRFAECYFDFAGLPNRFALVDDLVLSSQRIHCMPYKNYYVFYEIEETMNTVVVLRVGYNRRNWKEILLKK